jgi:hypothetical protein
VPNVEEEKIQEFIENLKKLTPDSQLIIFGIIKGIIAANEINLIEKEG